jgi:hypothetical protein
VAVPVVSHAFMPLPMSTSRLISAAWAQFCPLWPGSMTTVRPARPEAPAARGWDGGGAAGLGVAGAGFGAAGAAGGLAGVGAAVSLGAGVGAGMGLGIGLVGGLEGRMGAALAPEGAGEAGGLGVWTETARRWEGPEQAAASRATSSTSAARRPAEITTADTPQE